MSLKKELKLSKEPDLHESVILNMYLSGQMVDREHFELFKRYDLTSAQYNILRILKGAGEPVSCSYILDRLLTKVPDLTRLIDRLQKRGLVVRSQALSDRRSRLIQISKKGTETLEELEPKRNEIALKIVKRFKCRFF